MAEVQLASQTWTHKRHSYIIFFVSGDLWIWGEKGALIMGFTKLPKSWFSLKFSYSEKDFQDKTGNQIWVLMINSEELQPIAHVDLLLGNMQCYCYCTLNSHYRMKHWFDHQWGRDFQPVYGIGANPTSWFVVVFLLINGFETQFANRISHLNWLNENFTSVHKY